MQKITSAHGHALFGVAATRRIEHRAAALLPPFTLMQRAGFSVARLSLALAPHAKSIWVACGPGNNGGDGFQAAMHLQRWGKNVTVTCIEPGPNGLPPDAAVARKNALAAGVNFAAQPPEDFDFCIDALLGLGGSGALREARPGTRLMRDWLEAMHTSAAPRLAVDVPSGLDCDTGVPGSASSAINSGAARARIYSSKAIFTLSLLTLKPGLFTAHGRDAAGDVWFDDLGVSTKDEQPTANLLGADDATPVGRSLARHDSHKGVFGDVAVVGGQSAGSSHMVGAALLAARAALHAGAGRVFVALLGEGGLHVDVVQPELMFRSVDALDLENCTVVCGCGGGSAVQAVLPKVLSAAPRLVLDADALNAIAADPALAQLLKARALHGHSTVLTPHPLEAARLLGTTAAQVQLDRLQAAHQLAGMYGAVVVLKGSGTVVAAPGRTSCINHSGNAALATAGTGDVLAGMVGALLASGSAAFDAACAAVFRHGEVADEWSAHQRGLSLTASRLTAAV
jgi:ADP-dependent NAD(P)H-hydrate dehydratase / NAD(P)H-hydrate epimerase